MTRPLILDVDGTLLKNDLTHEMILEAVKCDPLRAPYYAWLGLRSKPQMKQAMVARIGSRLLNGPQPLEPAIVSLAKTAQSQSRAVYLCSGSEDSLVQRLAAKHDFIDGAFGTSSTYNMTSGNKAAFLEQEFPGGFDYAGNSTQDFAVWDVAHSAYGVRPPSGTEQTITATGEPVDILVERPPLSDKLPLILKGFELWKLLTLLLPVLLSVLFTPLTARDTLMLAVGLGLLFLAHTNGRNLRNVQRDRAHSPRARKDNPIASGDMSVPMGVVAFIILLGAGLSLTLSALL